MTPVARIRLWAGICLVLSAATSIQVLMYAPPVWGGEPIWGRGSPFGNASANSLYTPLVLFFLVGPGILAGGVSAWILHRAYAAAGAKPPLVAVFLLVALVLASCYAGVLISFNTWGT
ncbi:MAG TPA: hypothetical protein VMT45_15060 [Thermoanaerobaculaceae bacterium]|nr:hypothetical protein [Thermoanaerobaculaceae bacterium]